MNYSIHKAGKPEYPRITEIWELSVRASHHFLKEEDIIFFRNELTHYLDASELFVVRDNKGTIYGFMGTSKDEIEMLFIHPACQGKGIGTMLIKYAIDDLKKTKVTVNEQNKKALEFYRKFGFVVKNRTEKDPNGKDYPLLFMELDVSGTSEIL